ncbi:MAG: UDP-N-acetylmuramate dehydrogenase [bacterium]|nr:UDP-N-acetylmuramate dehydrogenase [bacterium]
MNKKLTKELCNLIKGEIRFNELLSKHTSFRIGGHADVWIYPKDISDIKNTLMFCNSYNIPVTILGGGTNVLISDKGIRGVVLNLEHGLCDIKIKGERITCGTGALLSKLLKQSARKELTGLEFTAGIPGTVGGAVSMNAGTKKNQKSKIKNQNLEYMGIGDLVESVKVIDMNGNISELGKNDLSFGYRKSNLYEYIIVEAELKLKRGKEKEINDRISRLLEHKKSTQVLDIPSAGCIFKNPDIHSSGRLIDKAGLKGLVIGDAQISEKHANFIVNNGNAKAQDVLELIKKIKLTVFEKTGVKLEEEIKVIGMQ